MNNEIIVTTKEQLAALIDERIDAIIPKLANFRRKNEAVETDGMDIKKAVQFLDEQGYPTTISSLYMRVHENTIPYKKIGRKLVFSKKDLRRWIDEESVDSEPQKEQAALLIAKSAARRK
ncbi:MAG: helix-turn-helix domain-containing protein [Alistipes sp.]|nr:helix-turn-helix domain-containing protein [Alistipes sp.]